MHIKPSKPSLLLIIILIIVSVIFISSLPKRIVHGDDAWFAEQAYWLAKDGVVRSELFRGRLDYETRQTFYLKLHIWQGALIALLPNWSIYNFKTISLIYLSFLLAGLFTIIRRFSSFESPNTYLILLILLLANGYLTEFAFVYRPEVSMSALGVWAFYNLLKYLEQNKLHNILISGLLTGLIVLFHLNGIIFVVAGVVLLIYSRNYKACVYFLVSSGLISAFYFIDVIYYNDYARFLAQSTYEPGLLDKDTTFFGFILSFINEPNRYFGHLREGTYSLLMFFVLLMGRKDILSNKQHKLTAIYLLALSVTLAFITPGKKPVYLILTMPYFLILVASQFERILNSGKAPGRTLVSLSLIYLLANQVFILQKFILHKNNLPRTQHEIITQYKIHNGARIAAPMSFVFNELPNFSIQEVTSYEIVARLDGDDPSKVDIGAYAKRFEREYIILPKWYIDDRKITSNRLSGYVYLGQNHGFYIYKLDNN